MDSFHPLSTSPSVPQLYTSPISHTHAGACGHTVSLLAVTVVLVLGALLEEKVTELSHCVLCVLLVLLSLLYSSNTVYCEYNEIRNSTAIDFRLLVDIIFVLYALSRITLC